MPFLLNLSSPVLLTLSLQALAIGPILFYFVRSRENFIKGLDGFVLVTICGLVLLHILPHTVEEIGWMAIVVLVLSLFLPTFLERLRGKMARTTHTLTLALAILGIALHAFTDGMALSDKLMPQHGSHGAMLPWAIVLHRIPDGLTIWWLMRPRYGNWAAYRTLFVMAVATLIGYFAGDVVFSNLSPRGVGMFEALVGGSLLHVIFHQDHPAWKKSAKGWQLASSLGVLAGFFVLYFLILDSALLSSASYLRQTLSTLKLLALESAPSLVIAYFFSGVLHTFMPRAGVSWLKKGSSASQALRGMMFGLPLPVCSCGVVPLYRSLILRGTPLAAAIAFFVATPELGVDAFLLTFPLLGSSFTLWRLAAAATVAFVTGLIVSKFGEPARITTSDSTSNKLLDAPENAIPFTQKIRQTFKQGFIDAVDDTGAWIALGLFIAALLSPLLKTSGLISQISPFWQVPLFTLIGMPLYVCASGATPLAAILIHGGLSPGAGLAFLLTGPATNATTYGILSRYHGKRTALVFAASMSTLAITMGYVVNAFLSPDQILPLTPELHQHVSLWQNAALIILLFLIGFSLLRRGPRAMLGDIMSFETDEEGNKIETHGHDHHGHAHSHKKSAVEPAAEKKKDCCH